MIIRRLSMNLGWSDTWALDPEDAAALAAIASRARKLRRDGYSGPFQFAEDNEPFVQQIAVVDIEVPDAVDTTGNVPSIYTAAVRNLP